MRDPKLFATYLNDRLVVAVVGRELVKRMLGRPGAFSDIAPLERASSELEAAERELERLLSQVGARPSRVKRGAAWAAEKAGRLKLNGRIVSRSPLSSVQELEGLSAILQLLALTYRALDRVASDLADAPAGFDSRAQAVDELLPEVERLRLAAVEHALA
jgi:hypothetical protein